MENETYRKLIDRLGWSGHQAAEYLGVSIRQHQYYMAGRIIPQPIGKLLRLLATPQKPTRKAGQNAADAPG